MSSLAPMQTHGSLQLNPTRRNSFYYWHARKSVVYSVYLSPKFQTNHFSSYGSRTKTKFAYRFLPSFLSASPLEYESGEMMIQLDVFSDYGTHTTYIDYLQQILHESARIVSTGIKNHESSRNYPKLAKAWIGMDVDTWHRRTAYQAAVYALLKSVLAIGEPFCDHSVDNILSPKIHEILVALDSQLSKRDLKLANWFRMEQLPSLTKCVTCILERCASHYVQSGSALSILAINCCVAIKKLFADRISLPPFTISIQDTIWELVESSPDFSSLDIMHQLASKAGVEHEFLMYFGPNVLNCDARGNIVFWMGMLQEKLVAAFCRESVITAMQLFCHSESQVIDMDLAVIGLFAFLGRKTRLFLARMGIKDLEDPVKDFICYLECGILFLYPELSSMCVYQQFMDVVADEIGWLELYTADPFTKNQERKRLKPHAIQAEKEIILSTVFGVCQDMFSSFAHYSEITEQSPSPNVHAYLHISKDLLMFCLEDYCAAFDRLCELRKSIHVQFPEPVIHTGNLREVVTSFPRKQCIQTHADIKSNDTAESVPQQMQHEWMPTCTDKILEMLPEAAEPKFHQSFLAKSCNSLLATTSDICMGTKMLFLDIKSAIGYIQKLIFGHPPTKREKQKIVRTVFDIICVIPIAILMLIPVTPIGHAAMLTAIKKYIPGLIPSPYSEVRLDIIKQLKRAKKMKVQSCREPGSVAMAF